MSLYFILLACSISVPFALSFDKKLQFYKHWKFVLPSIFLVAIFYIICDILLTKSGVWGFNSPYHSTLIFFNLPLEEWLFFIVIPYASIFLHEAFILYFPRIKVSDKISKSLSIILIIFLLTIVLFNINKIYTVYIFSLVIVALILALIGKDQAINHFYITFLLMLIPFFIVNAILTGSFIDQEVVWYNNNENLGLRFFTIPVEDFGYAFSMILFNILLINLLRKKNSTQVKINKNMLDTKTEILNLITNREKETRIFFIIFYLVGIIGLSISYTFIFFTKLVPFALILSFLTLALFHPDKENRSSLFVFLSIFLIGFVIEAIGVKTGLIFGNYQYGSSLGLKVFETPIIIGLNWLFLVYTTSSVLEKFGFHNIFKILLGSTLMLIYDIVLEQIAPKIDMWNWNDENIPLQNYIAWFLIALVFHTTLKVFRIKTQNPMSLFILVCQFLFFISLLFLLN